MEVPESCKGEQGRVNVNGRQGGYREALHYIIDHALRTRADVVPCGKRTTPEKRKGKEKQEKKKTLTAKTFSSFLLNICTSVNLAHTEGKVSFRFISVVCE